MGAARHCQNKCVGFCLKFRLRAETKGGNVMAGVILENLSGRKLAILVVSLIICQIVCFLIGGCIAPAPYNTMSVLGTLCVDTSQRHTWNTTKLISPRGKNRCESVDKLSDPKVTLEGYTANDIVFAFQFPLARGGVELEYSRWFQNLISVLQVNIEYNDDTPLVGRPTLTLDIRLGYRNEKDEDWKLYASSLEERALDCSIDEENRKEGHNYNCDLLPLFELGSIHHKSYLLNIRLPVSSKTSLNANIGRVTELHMTAINQNGGFTIVWLSMKTVFFPIIIGIMIWYWRRIKLLDRKPALLEKMLLALGIALTQLNFPMEFLTLWLEMPFMLLLGDIRQGVFYATLLSFWLVFAGEHLIDDIERNKMNSYWKHLSAVVFGCLCLFVFDMCERGVQLRNPFFSIWVTDVGTNLALSIIILAGISACIYFIFLSYMIFKVFRNIRVKRLTISSMSTTRRKFYEGVIYRFKFLMLATLLCAALTVISFIIGQVAEGRWKWDEDISLEYTSAFVCGVYGMWNIYVFALIVLYAPSHKRWADEQQALTPSTGEEIECSRLLSESSRESSALTALVQKTAAE